MTGEIVLLGLGSNIASRRRRLRSAVNRLVGTILRDAVLSSIYETEPVGYADQPSFLNIVIMGECLLSPSDLHLAVKNLEIAQGRVHRERWREREIDIDVLLYGDEIVRTDDLTIPHAHMHERRFVLVPAVEIAPDLVDPVSGCTLAELLAICPDSAEVQLADAPLALP
jgi:2-amino-4-hydroxy-6-hydroxymethyldihydropteridine diphosphokinase